MQQEDTGEQHDLAAADQHLGDNGEDATHENVVEETQPQEESKQERNWKAVNEALAEQQREIAELRAERNQRRQSQTQDPEKDYWQGRGKESIASVGDLESYVQNQFQSQAQKLQSKIADLEMRAIDPNYKKVIETYQNTLTETQIQAAIHSPNPYQAAYDTIVGSKAYYLDQMKRQTHSDAKKAQANLAKPNSAMHSGSRGALAHAGSFEHLSEDERIEMGDRFAHGG